MKDDTTLSEVMIELKYIQRDIAVLSDRIKDLVTHSELNSSVSVRDSKFNLIDKEIGEIKKSIQNKNRQAVLLTSILATVLSLAFAYIFNDLLKGGS